MYYIYRYVNKLNGKIYVGQTNNLDNKKREHKSDSYNPKSPGYNLPIHCAIRKYGLENFKLEVLERIDDCECQEYIDDREIFYIKECHSKVNEWGYNITDGGQGCRKRPLTYPELLEKSKLFSGDEIKDIQKSLIEDVDFDELMNKYAPRLKKSFLLNINCGLNFKNPDFDYPLKKYSKSRFSFKEIEEIKADIKTGMKYKEICDKWNIKSQGFISGVNSGKYFKDKINVYPLYNKQAKFKKKAMKIIDDLLMTNKSQRQIAKDNGVCPTTVGKINKGLSHRIPNLNYPLRKNN